MATANIPLYCSICPIRPNFSDVSHLLTHLASKGHLSSHYKAKIRATHDDETRRLVDAFDAWYTQWNVEELMSDRMTQKDKRRPRARPAARHSQTPRIEAPVPRPAHPRAVVGNLLDPRLSEQHLIKVESSYTPTPTPQPGPVLRHRPSRTFAAHLQYWPADSRASSRSLTNPDYDTSSEYSDPSERRPYPFSVEDTCAIVDDEAVEPSLGDTMTKSESTKLKGVIWPGMNLFDSATPEMRRRRNQKKDSSVLEQLEINSREVEPMELIFSPQGSLKRQRRISSSVLDDEEEFLQAETPTPSLSLSRPTLADLEVNMPQRHYRHLSTRPPPYYPVRSNYDDHMHSDFANGYGARMPNRRRAFTVYDDEEVSFAHPAGMSVLTSGFQHQISPTFTPAPQPFKGFTTGYYFDNKENVPPSAPVSAYEHHHAHQPGVNHFHTSAFGLDHEHNGMSYNHLFMQACHPNADDDDARTVTAPASPCAGAG